MTSEVIILNKKAVVIGADSAVTSMVGGKHPRYSKSADKLFELSANGSVAVMIHGSASIDGVPWELAIKLFGAELGGQTLRTVSEYATALLSFLSSNERLFPAASRAQALSAQINTAIKGVVKLAGETDPSVLDLALPLSTRQAAWAARAEGMRALLAATAAATPLTSTPTDAAPPTSGLWMKAAVDLIEQIETLSAVDASELADLGHQFLRAFPEQVLGSSGVVLAGYGDDQIFPAYVQLEVFGHSGDALFHRGAAEFVIGRDGLALIQPFAKTSTIDLFIRGYDRAMERVIEDQWKRSIVELVQHLRNAGLDIPTEPCDEVVTSAQAWFMRSWKERCSRRHATPLLGVLQSLSLQEMAQLAEMLLGLECMKERVTSPTETVAGPIDLAAITKAEGLVWTRRKHTVDAAINPLYVARLARAHI